MILVDFLIENRKMRIMEDEEARHVVRNAVLAGRINVASLISYSHRREFEVIASINQVQNNIFPEIVDS